MKGLFGSAWELDGAGGLGEATRITQDGGWGL